MLFMPALGVISSMRLLSVLVKKWLRRSSRRISKMVGRGPHPPSGAMIFPSMRTRGFCFSSLRRFLSVSETVGVFVRRIFDISSSV